MMAASGRHLIAVTQRAQHVVPDLGTVRAASGPFSVRSVLPVVNSSSSAPHH
jgi:hypothetical protein